MLSFVKNRTLSFGQKVLVYYNLHKNCFSVKDKKTGVVLLHASSIIIMDAKMRVSEKGRQRVIREKKKNVHATIEGTFVYAGEEDMSFLKLDTLYYNPYKVLSFIDTKTKKAVNEASIVVCNKKNVFYAKYNIYEV